MANGTSGEAFLEKPSAQRSFRPLPLRGMEGRKVRAALDPWLRPRLEYPLLVEM